MAEGAQAGTAVTTALPAAPTGGSPAGPTTAPSTQTAAGTGTQEFIQFEKARLAEFGGDLKEYDRAARLGRQADQSGLLEVQAYLTTQGITPKQMLEFWQKPDEAPTGAPAGEPPQTPPSPADGDKPLTEAKFMRIQEEQRAAAIKAQQEQAEQQHVNQGRQFRQQFAADVLKEVGFADNPKAQALLGTAIKDAVAEAIMETINVDIASAGWPADKKYYVSHNHQPFPHEVARAKQIVLDRLTDFRTILISNAARGQGAVPGASLVGGGIAGEGFDPNKLQGRAKAEYIAGPLPANMQR